MKFNEAKAIIQAIVTLRESATDEQALAAPAVYPAWKESVEYKSGERVLHNDILYKVIQAHTSQEGWTPDNATSLFAKVLIPDANVVPEWEQPNSTNGYMVGDKVQYNDKTWESLVDNNVWEPGAVGSDSLWKELTN